jgi:hypothetical protein
MCVHICMDACVCMYQRTPSIGHTMNTYTRTATRRRIREANATPSTHTKHRTNTQFIHIYIQRERESYKLIHTNTHTQLRADEYVMQTPHLQRTPSIEHTLNTYMHTHTHTELQINTYKHTHTATRRRIRDANTTPSAHTKHRTNSKRWPTYASTSVTIPPPGVPRSVTRK